MVARIFQPSRTAMQSGKAKTRRWVLEYEPAAPKEVEPLMGYTSSKDMRSQVKLTFDTKEQAIEYAERNGIDFRLEEPNAPKRVRVAYSDNFKYDRRQPWTH
ncbi:ETC complex I subunit [Jiella pelagia]|uniref:ETC complex I subunit n=1 Tax=Jiella pelagia TaxID=2986949 RepID=A0ABY7BU31_9HYPH|nr:ETC complex I subunit [Jiella pelagia]WAP67246.1 ETC complex I subunit [Jiella pelagia]